MAFTELLRTLKPAGKAAVVYSWGIHSPLMKLLARPNAWVSSILKIRRQKRGVVTGGRDQDVNPRKDSDILVSKPGTFTFKHDYQWIKSQLSDFPGLEIRVWRSVSTVFMRTFIHEKLLGKLLLRTIYMFEELMPRILGKNGQYPLILFGKPESSRSGER